MRCHRPVAASSCWADAWTLCSPEDNCQVCPTKFKPLPKDHITTKTSGIHGRGLYVKTPKGIKKDTVIVLVKGKWFKKGDNKATAFTIQVGSVYVEPTGPVRFVNHCCCPNSRFQKWSDANGEQEHVAIVSNTHLNPGEEVTVSYNNRNNFVDACKCGVVACRKQMTWYKTIVEAMKAAAPAEKSILVLFCIEARSMDKDFYSFPVWLVNDNAYFVEKAPNRIDLIACKREGLWTSFPLTRSKSKR
jgi:hypothetical protein